jgi:L-rhamnose isomerase
VRGFEGGTLDGGLAATGNHPGRARNADELRADLDRAYALIPGRHRINLHAIYAETGGRPVPRNELAPEHYARWIDWAVAGGHGMDFNPSCFSHPRAAGGITLTSPDSGTRRFWIEHCAACRRIGAAMGRATGSPCVTNVWIPDGSKDLPADRRAPRRRLRAALDEVFAEPLPATGLLDSVESKLFGIGSESYVAGSHEFYLGYAAERRILLCLDQGHFHPTEGVADKISAVLEFVPGLLLHLSRGVRWDSDHVVLLGDDLRQVCEELVRSEALDRTHVGLDFFDASINRVAAWAIGARNVLKGLLAALLEPGDRLRDWEAAGDLTARLLVIEELKTLPLGAVWDQHCLQQGVPVGLDLLTAIRDHEAAVIARRG